ncbi:MAG TPA: type II secretion system F family protein [Candidatus Limnocylindria bacterium]|nr:type II secretion system F family protein [Candidatus Limnocylindria bacterium]
MDKPLKVPKPKQAIFGFLKTFGIGKEKDAFMENLSLMLAADMPVAQALNAAKGDIASRRLLKIVEELENDINSGQHFWQAFTKAGLFPAYVVSLIKIGEESGRLSENLKVISGQQAKDQLFKQRIRSAMIYPCIVFGLALVVGIGIAWFILPRLAGVFLNLKLKLPLPTRMLIALGVFLQHWGIIAVPLFLFGFFIFFFFLFFNPKTKFLGQKLLFALPGVKALIQEVELARFTYVLGSLLGAGVPVVEAVDLSSQASTFVNYKKFLENLKISLEEGNSFQSSFHAYPKAKKLIPAAVQQLIVSAEQSGKLQQVLLSVAKTYEEKSENSTKNLAVVVEPIMLIIVWVGVAMVALSVILPIYNLIGGLNSINEPAAKAAPVRSSTKLKDASVTSSAPNLATSTASSTLPSVKGESIINLKGSLKILGGIKYLYVRQEPSTKAKVITKVYSGEIYTFTQEQPLNSSWFNIILKDGQTGWVSGDYVSVHRE